MAGKARRIAAAKRARALGQAIGRSGANRPRAAHHHFFDGPRRFAKIRRADYFKAVGQQPLLDQLDGVFARVESDGAIMARAPAYGDVHEDTLAVLPAQATAE